jgi:hypothetical protein
MRFDDPAELFNEAQSAYQAGDWKRFGACFDPVSLEVFRDENLGFLRRVMPPVTPERMMRQDPSMPREVAEHFAKQASVQVEQIVRIQQEFPDIQCIEELETLSPADFYSASVEGKSYHRQIKRLIAEGRIRPGKEYNSAEKIPDPELVAVGWMPDGHRIAHVVYRNRNEGAHRSAQAWIDSIPEKVRAFTVEMAKRGHTVHVAQCWRQDDGSWRIVASHDFFRAGMLVGLLPAENEDDNK